ncbi:hypothetical protein [Mycobacteroides chelonae]|uniref:hypothetical protein n=1 Tax=Mycobacteroides chelonae TaxID=1774 RepID=UPI0015914229
MMVENLTGLGVVAFWVVLLLRLPEVLRQKEFRSMYFSVVALGLSVTLYYRPIAVFLAELFGSARPCNIGMNLWGILTSGVVAALVARELWPRAVKVVYGLTAAGLVVVAVIGQTVSQGSIGCATALDLPWWDPYWWLLCGAWISAMACAVLLCVRSIRAAAGMPALTATMVCFLIGFASSLLFWIGIFSFLVLRPPWVLSALPIVLLFHVWFHTLGLFIGVVTSAGSWVNSALAMRRRLRLLRRLEHFEHTSQTSRRALHAGLWRDFVRSPRLGVYRAEVQILDSLALMGDQVLAAGQAGSAAAAGIVEYAKSAECADAEGGILFDKLETFVRELNEENGIRGNLHQR